MITEFPKVLRKALIILVLFILLDLIFGLLYKSFYISQGPSRFSKMIYGNKGGNKEEIIVLGDSRAEHHYNSEMIAEITGKSVYNYGSDGQSVFYNYAVLRDLLDSYIPEKVIYEISLYELEYADMAYDRLLYFLPLNNEYAEAILAKKMGALNLFFSKLFNAYKYNSSVFIILKSYFSPKDYIAGYQPLTHSLDERLFKEDPSGIINKTTTYPIDSLKLIYFNKILQLSKEFNFELVLFISPTLFQTENEILLSTIKTCLSKYNYPFFNYLNDTSYNVTLFADPIHLNDKGADIFTGQIISLLD